MSDGLGFGYYQGDAQQDDLDQNGQGQQGQQQGDDKPNGFRQYLKSLEESNKALMKRLEGLEGESRRNRVADELESKGYDRAAAALFTGDPEKVDEWLTSAGSLLAKRPDAQQGAAGTQQQGGTPNTTVTPDGQAQLQQLQQMGQNAAAPQGSDTEQAAAIAAITDPQKLTEYLAGQGNQFAQLYQNGGY